MITFLTDFAVHPLWVHDGVDLHLAIHPNAATEATSRGANFTLCPGALVHPRFRDSTGRDETRAALGLALGDVVVLIVAGSWGVGDVDETVADISRDTCLKSIVVCGEDEPLRRKLTAEGKGIVLGWTDNMADLMAAADILVENAGGLTSLEAMAAGLPVITYRPIPGHGRDNAAAMDRAGVSWHARNRQELFVALERLSYNSPERNHMRPCVFGAGRTARVHQALLERDVRIPLPGPRPRVARWAESDVTTGGLRRALARRKAIDLAPCARSVRSTAVASAGLGCMMSGKHDRPRHPHPDIEAAVQYALRKRWAYVRSRGHPCVRSLFRWCGGGLDRECWAGFGDPTIQQRSP